MKYGSFVSAVAGLSLTALACGELVIPLDGGWQATVLDDAMADLSVDFLGEDLLVLEKFAEFWKLDDMTGTPVPIRIMFEQVASDAETVSRIAITDEMIINHTGLGWLDFHMELLSPIAVWNPEDSADFSYDPFETMAFSDDLHSVDFDDGFIPDDGVWMPGMTSGALYIDIDLSPTDPVCFVLKEFPTPAPGAWALLAAGFLAARRRTS